jgi:hypothetical protein
MHNNKPKYNILAATQQFNADLLQLQPLINNDNYDIIVYYFNNNIYTFRYFVKSELDEIDITQANYYNTLQTMQTYFTVAIFNSEQTIERIKHQLLLRGLTP